MHIMLKGQCWTVQLSVLQNLLKTFVKEKVKDRKAYGGYLGIQSGCMSKRQPLFAPIAEVSTLHPPPLLPCPPPYPSSRHHFS